jgi:hypothetical protein
MYFMLPQEHALWSPTQQMHRLQLSARMSQYETQTILSLYGIPGEYIYFSLIAFTVGSFLSTVFNSSQNQSAVTLIKNSYLLFYEMNESLV